MNETTLAVPLPLDLSVCMIVRDEEQALPRCLRSVAAVAREIIVVEVLKELAEQGGFFELLGSSRHGFSNLRGRYLRRRATLG